MLLASQAKPDDCNGICFAALLNYEGNNIKMETVAHLGSGSLYNPDHYHFVNSTQGG